MATRGGGVGSGKEREKKKGSTPLNPQPKKTTTKPSTPTSSPEHKPASSSQKPLPNYLKPTKSSSLDFSPRRASIGGSTTPAKPAHNRKNSLDKPPAPTHVQKDLPEAKNPRLPKKPPAQRSLSSLSARSVKTTGLPVLRRSASTKVSPASSSNSTNVKSVPRKAGPKSVTSESSVELEPHERDPLDQMISGGNEAGHPSDQREVLSLSDISEMPGQEEKLGDPSNTLQKVIDSKTTHCEVKVAEKVEDQETDASHENLNEKTVESLRLIDQGVEEKHVVVEVAAEESKEGKGVNLPASPVKLESPVKQVQSGKKEAQAYNDVIEETATKLMEKRNKVRALAGAFETVISLQDK